MEKEKKFIEAKSADINFTFEDMGFNYRVGAFITCRDHILLQRTNDYDFWNMVGGRVKLRESSYEAINREIKEEIGLENLNLKLFVIAENFFMWEGYKAHEMLYIFRVELPEELFDKFVDFKILDKQEERTKWIHKDEIKNEHCLPKFIKDLWNLGDGIHHIINK